MDILWAAWRSQYIQAFKEEETAKTDDSCFFCDAIAGTGKDKEYLVAYRGTNCIVILNRYPYNGGHLLIAPKRHIGSLDEISNDELFEIMTLIKFSTNAIDRISKPHGYNIGANIGRASGAGVPGHIHFHVVPRWNGDTNFMSVISDTKIISQALDESWELISNEFKLLGTSKQGAI